MTRSLLKLESRLYWCGSGGFSPALGTAGLKNPLLVLTNTKVLGRLFISISLTMVTPGWFY